MSICGIGSGASQLLPTLLSRLDSTASASSTSSAATTTSAASTTSSTAAADNSLTGSGKAELSAQILGLLMMMQGDPSQTAASGTQAGTSSPLTNLVSAIDTNGDGTISQSELESYITSNGGTQAEADALYAGLGGNGSSGLTETQLASDLQNAGAGAVHHGHHGHHHQAASADEVGSQLVQAMDTNGDGTVDQSEFESFVTALGGTTSEADADFSALNSGGDGITASQFSQGITALEQASSAANGAKSPILTLLDDLAQTGSSSSTASATV